MHQVRICQPRTDTDVYCFQFEIRGDHGRQAGVVSIVKYLEEFFLRPLGAALRAQVIQDEQRCVTYLVEALVVGGGAVRAIRRAQVVQQVRYDDEQRWPSACYLLVGDGRRQVGLATAVTTQEHQPSLGFIGIVVDGLVDLAQINAFLLSQSQAIRQKTVEGVTGQSVQVAQCA